MLQNVPSADGDLLQDKDHVQYVEYLLTQTCFLFIDVRVATINCDLAQGIPDPEKTDLIFCTNLIY